MPEAEIERVSAQRSPKLNNIERVGYSIPYVSRRFGFSESLGYREARAGRFPGCKRLGHRFIIDLRIFEAWIQSGGKLGN